MKENIASYLRKMALLMEEDDTPTRMELDKKKEKIEPSSENIVVKHPRTESEITERKFRPSPKIKPKRRQTTTPKFDNKDVRKEHMENYRAEGKDLETGNKYVKKFKGE